MGAERRLQQTLLWIQAPTSGTEIILELERLTKFKMNFHGEGISSQPHPCLLQAASVVVTPLPPSSSFKVMLLISTTNCPIH